jgi:hypothetical protein
MEDTASPNEIRTDGEDGRRPHVAARREQARQYLAAQQRRLGELEASLAHKLGQLSRELTQARDAAIETESDLNESRSQLEAATKKLRLDERGLAQLRRECEANAEELAYHRQRLQQKLTELEIEREKLVEMQAQTKGQRLTIAHQFKAQREEIRREYQRQRAELDERRAASSEPGELARQLEEARRRLADADERQRAEQQTSPKTDEVQRQALDDMRRRYELAMEDLREQKRLVAELEKKATTAPHAPPAAVPGDKLDWEAQKQRLLAALEAEPDDDDDEERQQERLKMREVIEHTDAALAAKDREIDELKQLLSSQSANLGDVAVGAAAFAELLSSDEIVRSERERLQQLQHEWEEKLRQAEIDLSVQRARIARERAEIEERQRLFKEQQPEGASDDAGAATPVKPQRGRWLARLGLKDDEP